MMAQVKTVEYTEVLGAYLYGFKSMDTHMAEMMNGGWRVQSTLRREPVRGLWKRPGAMVVTYIKD